MADAPSGYTKKADVKVSSDLQAAWKASAASGSAAPERAGAWVAGSIVAVAVAIPLVWAYVGYRGVEQQKLSEDAAEALQPRRPAPTQFTPGASIRNPSNCELLANIGAVVFVARQGGHSLESVLATAVIPGQPQKTEVAQGVVLAIYGDGAIKSSTMARAAVMKACSR